MALKYSRGPRDFFIHLKQSKEKHILDPHFKNSRQHSHPFQFIEPILYKSNHQACLI